jgi:hypothetical protein
LKRIVLTVVLALAPAQAFPAVRYMVQDMTCAEVKYALDRDGVAILYRKSGKAGVPLYDRYVANKSQCQAGQEVIGEGIPTADTNSCRVSKCMDQSRFGNNR